MLNVKEQRAYYESEAFKEHYIYEGSDLGAIGLKDSTQFKLWSPLAGHVTLNLYHTGEDLEPYISVPMEKTQEGVWMYCMSGCGHGTYYDYVIEIDGEIFQSADPYAKGCCCNGMRSMVVAPGLTDPDGWENDRAPDRTDEQIIYEVHVKDFSFDPASGVPEEYRGKYKAFTVEGTTLNGDGIHPTCLDYLKALGITHVQLMPVFDFGSVDEGGSPEQYNWGYDPWNYNVPEGSYATDPYDGEVRIRELKELVMALHKSGIRVIMDVVYNHTYHLDSWFQKTAPGYFYRQLADGSWSDGSACGNDFAAEREMCGKYILESVMYWAEEYHIDGFRFDLMGLMNVELLNKIRHTLDFRFGSGEKLVYGEPWSAGDSPMSAGHYPCRKENIHMLDAEIGVFSDDTRDSIRGHVFYHHVPGFVNGGKGLENKILGSIRAWSGVYDNFRIKAPSQLITYVSAHDNMTLWDKLMATMKPGAPFDVRDEDVVRAYKMAAAVYFTCQGRLFFLAGEEAGRTKLGNDNSYASSPQLNQLDWQRFYAYEDILNWYRGLIAFRRQMPGLWDKSSKAADRVFNERIADEGIIQFSLHNEEHPRWDMLEIWYNSTDKAQTMKLPEGIWELLISPDSSWEWQQPETAGAAAEARPKSVMVFGRKR